MDKERLLRARIVCSENQHKRFKRIQQEIQKSTQLTIGHPETVEIMCKLAEKEYKIKVSK